MQTEENRPLWIGWRDLDFPKIASFRTQLGPDVTDTDGLPTRKLSITQAKGEGAANQILSRKSRGESVTWHSRLVTPVINTAKQEQGLERTTSDLLHSCTATEESEERPASAHLPSIPSQCGADRSEYHSRLPAVAACCGSCLARRWRPAWLCSRCSHRPGGLCKCHVSHCLPPAAFPGLRAWVGGLRVWDAETQEEED